LIPGPLRITNLEKGRQLKHGKGPATPTWKTDHNANLENLTTNLEVVVMVNRVKWITNMEKTGNANLEKGRQLQTPTWKETPCW